ncbi:bifunctional UDP-N-acetylglucosamine diphosphorylase/glucosamine-1-phosphate N-acetyltransferase GlmU [Candidatus Lucifugimonas marina]|uniref:Bifunctional protein GlmU n=1 Tax=Candidatus Lucifugimonas marina TaxID=3038979 RepID=A0AAJ6CSN6_9CHLR|nr:UDP-N-acetylglucosamine diphosphorylase/glucosamine-1-phosphate N-acetyltransferase [SAR202 cluster bacterium JH639]WFG38557.1 UDP-N-acetylglucosamine diphosphorylase/glucosamine-1-phosphate N-acetyltransferase [SAR202 cluster bacterium JH1073]
MTTAGIILAAGKGTRMKSKLNKPLHKVGGVALVGHTVRIMRIAGVEDIAVVVSRDIADSPELRDALLPNVSIVVQEEQLGTADATKSARYAVAGADSVLVAPADMILVTDEIVDQMTKLHQESDSLATVLGAIVDDASGLGRIKLDASGQPTAIVEEHEADDELLLSKLINTAWYCFDNKWVWDVLDSVTPADTGEVYLPRVIETASADQRSRVVVSNDSETGMGVNDRIQLSRVEAVMRRRTNEAHMGSGVTLQDPDNTYIDVDVEIGSDTYIGAGSQIGTRSVIGTNVVIGPNSQIASSTIGDGATVDGARVIGSVVGERASVGRNSLLRGGTELKPGSKVGNLAEIKNSVIGSGSSVSHFSYVGDATLGENVNIGAGTVTCNYDGKDKHPTVIEDDALIGSSTMLVAPVTIGKAARTGAGAVVRSDVMAGDTVAGVPAQSIKSK